MPNNATDQLEAELKNLEEQLICNQAVIEADFERYFSLLHVRAAPFADEEEKVSDPSDGSVDLERVIESFQHVSKEFNRLAKPLALARWSDQDFAEAERDFLERLTAFSEDLDLLCETEPERLDKLTFPSYLSFDGLYGMVSTAKSSSGYTEYTTYLIELQSLIKKVMENKERISCLRDCFTSLMNLKYVLRGIPDPAITDPQYGVFHACFLDESRFKFLLESLGVFTEMLRERNEAPIPDQRRVRLYIIEHAQTASSEVVAGAAEPLFTHMNKVLSQLRKLLKQTQGKKLHSLYEKIGEEYCLLLDQLKQQLRLKKYASSLKTIDELHDFIRYFGSVILRNRELIPKECEECYVALFGQQSCISISQTSPDGKKVLEQEIDVQDGTLMALKKLLETFLPLYKKLKCEVLDSMPTQMDEVIGIISALSRDIHQHLCEQRQRIDHHSLLKAELVSRQTARQSAAALGAGHFQRPSAFHHPSSDDVLRP